MAPRTFLAALLVEAVPDHVSKIGFAPFAYYRVMLGTCAGADLPVASTEGPRAADSTR